MARRKRSPRTPLTPAERRLRSRELLVDQVMNAVIEGYSLASISRREHMPSYDTLQRWRDNDGAFRNRFEGALNFQKHVMADDVLTIVDSAAASAHGRARAKAARSQIAARNWWIEFHRKEDLKSAAKTTDSLSETEILERLKRGLERVRKNDPEAADRLAGTTR